MRKIAIAAAVVALAGALVYWFGFRDRGEAGTKPTAAAGKDDPWSAPKKAAPKEAPKGGGGGGGRMPVLAHETDPDGPLLLEGLVLDENEKPVAGAEVRISSSPARTTKTDTDGTFSFDKLLGRTYALNARAGDRIGRAVAKVTSKPEPVVIRMRAGTTLTVMVTDAVTHKPIGGARVMRNAESNDDEVKTGADGKAVLRGIDEGWVGVTAVATGYGPASAVKNVGDDREVRIDLALSPGAALSGRVVDERGAAVASAKVWAVDGASAWDSGAGAKLAVTSGKDGSFTIPALSAGSYIVHGKSEIHAPSETSPILVSGDSPTTGVTLVMKDASLLAGVVVTPDGTPVPYASVRVASKTMARDMTYRQASADDKGTFEIKGLPRAAMRVRADGEEASSQAVEVDLAAKPDQRDVKLVLDVGGSIAGIVVDETGEPIAEATVKCYPDFMAGEIQDGNFVLASDATATSDGDGRFTLHGLEKGKYRVWADRGNRRGRNDGNDGVKAETGDRDVRVVLPAPGGIKGKVALTGGEPPELAIVSSGWEHRVTVRDGNFELGDLQPGKYDVRISGQDFAEKVKADVKVEPGKVTDLGNITLLAGRSLSGRVVDHAGAPVQGARVMFGRLLFGDGKQTGSDDAETSSSFGLKSGITNAAGEFTLKGAPRTPGVIVAEHASLGRSVAIKLPGGTEDISGIAITLKRFGSVVGKVTRLGASVPSAQVNVAPLNVGGQASFVVAGADGTFVVPKVPEGPTSISVSRNDGMGSVGASRTITVIAGQEVDGSVIIPAGNLTLKVKIEPKAGDQVDAAQIFVFNGTVTSRNADEIMAVYTARGSGDQTDIDKTEATMGASAAMAFWFPALGVATFKEMLAGNYSVCAIPITGAIDQTFMTRVFANLDKLDVYCKPVTIQPAPPVQQIPFMVPAMTPLPTGEEEE
jgi:hypothetical protein